MRIVVRTSMALVALAAAALSYQSLAHLGLLCGYAGLAWLYPLVVDAGAAASCAAWLHTRGRQPLAMTWTLLAVSVLLNGTTHYLESTGTAPSWLLVVGVAAIPPLVLGLCVHLAVGMGAQLAHTPDAGPTGISSPAVGTAEVRSDDVGTADVVDPVDELIESGAGRRRIAAVAGISEHQARVLLAERRNGASS